MVRFEYILFFVLFSSVSCFDRTTPSVNETQEQGAGTINKFKMFVGLKKAWIEKKLNDTEPIKSQPRMIIEKGNPKNEILDDSVTKLYRKDSESTVGNWSTTKSHGRFKVIRIIGEKFLKSEFEC